MFNVKLAEELSETDIYRIGKLLEYGYSILEIGTMLEVPLPVVADMKREKSGHG